LQASFPLALAQEWSIQEKQSPTLRFKANYQAVLPPHASCSPHVVGLGFSRVDFDLAEDDTSAEADLARRGKVLGSADYIASEQIVDSRKSHM
jgi:hypothetical protein